MPRAIVLLAIVCLCRLAYAETPEAGAPDWFSQGANALTVPSSSPYYSSGTDVTRAEAYTPPATNAQPAQNAPPGPPSAQGEASVASAAPSARPPTDAQLAAAVPVAPFARVIPNVPRPVEPDHADAEASPVNAAPAPTTRVPVNVAPPPPGPPPPPEPVWSTTLSNASVPSEEKAESKQEALWVRVVALVLLVGLVAVVAVLAARPSQRPPTPRR